MISIRLITIFGMWSMTGPFQRIAQSLWRITLMLKMASWSLSWIRSLDRLTRTPSQSQIQILNHNHSLRPTLRHALHKNLIMKQSCTAILVSHRSITLQTAALVALNAICLGLQAIPIGGIQMRRPAAVYLSRKPQMITSMANWLRTRKLVFVLKAVLSAVGVGPRKIQ